MQLLTTAYRFKHFSSKKPAKLSHFSVFWQKRPLEISKLAPKKALVLSQRHSCAGTISKSMPEQWSYVVTRLEVGGLSCDPYVFWYWAGMIVDCKAMGTKKGKEWGHSSADAQWAFACTWLEETGVCTCLPTWLISTPDRSIWTKTKTANPVKVLANLDWKLWLPTWHSVSDRR